MKCHASKLVGTTPCETRQSCDINAWLESIEQEHAKQMLAKVGGNHKDALNALLSLANLVMGIEKQ